MFKKRNLLTITGTCSALVLLLSIATVSAQGFTGTAIRPAFPRDDNKRTQSIFIHTLEPGQSIEDGVKLINNTGETKTVKLDAVDSVISSGGSFACAQSADAKQKVGEWITLAQNTVTLEPDENIVIPFGIDVPNNADTGEHNGCITLQDDEEVEEVNGSGVNINKRSAIRVSILVPGQIERSVEVTNLKVTDRGDKGIILTSHVRNTGNVSADTDVDVNVNNLFGRLVFSDGGEFPVQRGQDTEWNFKMDRPFWGGWYTAAFSISYLDGVNEVGDEGGDLITKTSEPARFFVMPQPTALLAMAAALLLVVGALTASLMWWWHKRHLKRTWVKYRIKHGNSVKSLATERKTTWRKIVKINKLSPPYDLKAGRIIKVPRREIKHKKRIKVRLH